MREECCEANSYGFPCHCSAYRGLSQRIAEDEGQADHDRDRDLDREEDD
jgi:hypothetical protein